MSAAKLKPWQRVLLWPPLRFVLPTATTLYYNHLRLRDELKTFKLPPELWAQQEAKALLLRSEDRLRSLEAKGPGLATVAAVVAAGVVAAIIEGGSDATLVGKVLLGMAAWYAIWSLLVPIYLVGPQSRDTIDLNHVIVAAKSESPQQYLAVQAQEAAQGNVRRAHRIGNLQDAARNELSAALAMLTVWLVLGPAVGLLERDESHLGREPPPPAQTPPPPKTPSLPTARRPTTPPPETATKPRRPLTTPTVPSTGGAQGPSEVR